MKTMKRFIKALHHLLIMSYFTSMYMGMAKSRVRSAKQDFSMAVSASIPRSRFKMASTLATTFNAGDIVPIFLQEILPGDTMAMEMTQVTRMLTPLAPTMDNVELDYYAFFVPHRLVWDGWEELMGENKTDDWTPSALHEGVPMYTAATALVEGKLGDYYGLPIGMEFDDHNASVLPFRGYGLIYNEWFRDQNLQSPISLYEDDSNAASAGGYTTTPDCNSDLLKANKQHDYFTSCLPSPQKSIEDQLIPLNLNDLIPVITQESTYVPTQTYAAKWAATGTGVAESQKTLATASDGDTTADQAATPSGNELYINNMWADASATGAATINDLRRAFQIQKMYEKDARGGSRYVEHIKAHFGVDAMDYRLQRPEYLGHAKNHIGIQQVVDQNGASTLGDTAAYAHSAGQHMLFNKSFTEHGYLHIFVVARQRKTYQQGLERHWSRHDRLDFYHPVLAHLGEQPVYAKEIFAVPDGTGPVATDLVFGYQEAWADYRYKPSKVTGQMRSANTNTFEIWHYADDYANPVTLSDSWIQDNSYTNINRTLAVQNKDQFKMNCYFNLIATRPMPTHSIPGYMDHF